MGCIDIYWGVFGNLIKMKTLRSNVGLGMIVHDFMNFL